jgi:hypothetical protein
MAQEHDSSFITQMACAQARFIHVPGNKKTPDGGVHDLFVISGRSDAPACNIKQPDFVAALAEGNVIFRIPTPLFGLGLVEATPDDNLEAAAFTPLAASLGIVAHFNRNGNDGTIARFGRGRKVLPIFAGEASMSSRALPANSFRTSVRPAGLSIQHAARGCDNPRTNSTAAAPLQTMRQMLQFAGFIRGLAPPVPFPTRHPRRLYPGVPECRMPSPPCDAQTTADGIQYSPSAFRSAYDGRNPADEPTRRGRGQ